MRPAATDTSHRNCSAQVTASEPAQVQRDRTHSPIRFQCPEPHTSGTAPAYGIHSTRLEFIADTVDRRACEHITDAERAELKTGRVPARLAVTEEA